MVSDTVMMILAFVAEVTMVLLCLHIVFNKKIKLDRYAVIAVVLICTLCYMTTEKVLPAYYSILIYGIYLVYCRLKFQDKWNVLIIKYILGFLLAAVIETGMSLLMTFGEIREGSSEELLFYSCLTNFITIIIYVKRKGKELYFSNKLVYWSFPSCIAMIFILTDYKIHQSKIKLLDLFVLVFLAFLYIYIVKSEMVNLKIENKNRELQMQEKYGKEYEKLVDMVRKRQHDYKNQLAAIRGMKDIADSQIDNFKLKEEYFSALEDKDRYTSLLTGCNQPIIAGYLFYQCKIFEKDNILLEYDLRVDRLEEWHPLYEFVEVLGIFFENAREECVGYQEHERRILFSLNEDHEKIVFSISNPAEYMTSEQIEKCFQWDYSTKGDNRGLGLPRAQELLSERNATIEVKNINIDSINWLQFVIVLKK